MGSESSGSFGTKTSENCDLYDPYELGSSESDPESSKVSGEPHGARHGGSMRGGFDVAPPSSGFNDGGSPWDSTYSRSGVMPNKLNQGTSTHRAPVSEASAYPQSKYGARSSDVGESTLVGGTDKEVIGSFGMPQLGMHVDYQHQSAFIATGTQRPPSELKRKRSQSPRSESNSQPFTCGLCKVQSFQAKIIEDHLENRLHWETLEHIQKQNQYDDVAIAFLHEAITHEFRQSVLQSQFMDQNINEVLDDVKDKDHMMKVEMMHCAPCKIYIPMTVVAVQHHLSSSDHQWNKTEFSEKQKGDSVASAQSMMEQLNSQYTRFLKGEYPFE